MTNLCERNARLLMNNLSIYFALFWALGLILMGLFIRYYLRVKRNADIKDKYINKLIFLAFLTGFNHEFLYSSPASVIESAEYLLHVNRTVPDIIHPSYWRRDVFQYGHLLPISTQKALLENGFRIAKTTLSTYVFERPNSGLDLSIDAGYFLVHYSVTGSNAVDPYDADGDSVPEYVERVILVLEEVYDHQINGLGYFPPPSDIYNPDTSDIGGTDQYDVYIKSMSYGYYGYVQADQGIGDNPSSSTVESDAYTSYMVLKNNYDGYPKTEIENLRVTIAHEFFHSIQFGYNAWETSWLMEATSVWMEESTYDNINDCYQYLIPWFSAPEETLTPSNDSRWYGSYIYFQYIDEHLGGSTTIKKIWENSVAANSYSVNSNVDIIDDALSSESSNFIDALHKMAIANRILSPNYKAGDFSLSEANAYRAYAEEKGETDFPAIAGTIQFSAGNSLFVTSQNLERYGNQYYYIIPSSPIYCQLNPLYGVSSDYKMSAICKDFDGNYIIKTGTGINLDAQTNGYDWVFLVVSGVDKVLSHFDYEVLFTDGEVSSDSSNGFNINTLYPNPFKPRHGNNQNLLHLGLESSSSIKVKVLIYDLLGRKISDLFDGVVYENVVKVYYLE